MHLCLAWCLYKSQVIISLLHINISLAINPLLYLATCSKLTINLGTRPKNFVREIMGHALIVNN